MAATLSLPKPPAPEAAPGVVIPRCLLVALDRLAWPVAVTIGALLSALPESDRKAFRRAKLCDSFEASRIGMRAAGYRIARARCGRFGVTIFEDADADPATAAAAVEALAALIVEQGRRCGVEQAALICPGMAS